jgi:signal transduction histidine kinase
VDYLASWEFSVFLFYALPIFISSWYGDRTLGICFALLSGLTWFSANLHSTPYTTSQGFIWAGVTRIAYFAFIGVGANAIRKLNEANAAKVLALERTGELERKLVRASEREQMRIGQDLHDGVCQDLAALDCALECLRLELRQRSPSEAETAEVIQRFLKEITIETRGLARGIWPVHLEGEGLQTALTALVRRFSQARDITVRFLSEGKVCIDDASVAMHLYRIAQEALSNAVRHSNADSIFVTLTAEVGGIVLTVRDNGVGMDYADVSKSGMGLATMRYRAASLGAALEIRRNRPFGTMVRCTVAR